MQPGGPLNVEHRESLRRLLRRRGRRMKAGANSHEQTRLHAWHSSYSHMPSSDHSSTTRWLVVSLLLAFFLVVPTGFSLMENLLETPDRTFGEWLQAAEAAVLGAAARIVLTIVAILVGLVLISPLLWIMVCLDGDSESARRSLIEKADRINARKAAEREAQLNNM